MKLILFAKHLKGMNISELVQEAKRAQADGLDFPVRDGYAVNPSNVSSALPELIRSLESEGFCLPMCTTETALTDPDAPSAEPLLAAMGENHVSLLKIGYFNFDAVKQDYWQEVDRIRRLLERWSKLGEKHGVTICYHTHSGPYVGSTASGLLHLIRGSDPRYIGAYLDAGHLSAAGEDFPMACSIAGGYLRIVGVKEVINVWKETNGRKTVQRIATPLGTGWLDLNEVFSHLVRIRFNGPVTLHVEYSGTQEQLIQDARRDMRVLRASLNGARSG